MLHVYIYDAVCVTLPTLSIIMSNGVFFSNFDFFPLQITHRMFHVMSQRDLPVAHCDILGFGPQEKK